MNTYRAVFKVAGMPAKFVIEILAEHMSDAVDMVKERVDVITSLPGGYGAVREAIEILLKHLGLFDMVMERYVG